MHADQGGSAREFDEEGRFPAAISARVTWLVALSLMSAFSKKVSRAS